MKDKIFLDTNIVVDLLGERDPFYESAAKIATLADKGIITIYVSALTYTTTYYLLAQCEDKKIVKDKIKKFTVLAETVDVTNEIIEKGLTSIFSDFENALQYYCAVKMDCNIIITRNGKDFKESAISVLTPDEYLNSLKNK